MFDALPFRRPAFKKQLLVVSFSYVTDGTVAILVSMLFFVVPSELPRCGGYGCDKEGDCLLTY